MSKYSFDVSSMSVEDIRLKMMSLENEYTAKRDKIVSLIGDLESLDKAYITLKEELGKRSPV